MGCKITLKIWISVVCLVILTGLAQADTITVGPGGPGGGYDYATIQGGIDAANNGDEVVVAEGTYTGTGNRDIDFDSKAITVRSTDPCNPAVVAATIIDCENSGRGFVFNNSEGSGSVLSGLMITNGRGALYGGGIYCVGSSPIIHSCLIKHNGAKRGGGVYFYGASPTIKNCTITENMTVDIPEMDRSLGGGIYCEAATVTIDSCIITNNSADHIADWGGGIHCQNGTVMFTYCTIMGNSGDSGSALFHFQGNVAISSSILWDNQGSHGVGGSPISVAYSDMQGGYPGTNNINADPCFIAPVAGDYHLALGSPCIDTGDPGHVPIAGQTDIDGEARVMGGRVDMGADEFNDQVPLIKVSPADLEFNADEGGSNPDDQILSIRNAGASTLSWQITEDCPWLEVDPNNGESSGEVNEVAVSVDISGLVCGAYDYNLTISDPCAINSPRTVAVSLIVYGPAISLSPEEFEFKALEGGANPADQVLSIQGSGFGLLEWVISHDCNWLEVNPNSGSSAGEPNEVILTVDISELSSGTYNCELMITAPCAFNSPQIVPVNLLITGPIIELSAMNFEFRAIVGGTDPEDQILTIRNSGLGTLNWEIAEDCDWLSVDPNMGSSTGEVDDVTLSADISGLGGGSYNCELLVSDPNAENNPQTITVILRLGDSDSQLHVPSEYTTIQEAIDVAWEGDTVIIAEGTYTGAGNKNLDYDSKAITVRSTDPNDPCVVTATIIDCENDGRGFYFHSGEDANSIVAGLTVTNGKIEGTSGNYDAYGGGIHCSGASPAILNCSILNCSVYGYDCSHCWGGPAGKAFGGGIACISDSHPTIVNCEISGNLARAPYTMEGWADAYGGGVFCSFDSNVAIYNSRITANIAHGGKVMSDASWISYARNSYGGGIYISGSIGSNIQNCLLANNETVLVIGEDYEGLNYGISRGAGIYCGENTTITNCTLYGNYTDPTGIRGDGGGIYGPATVINCIVWGNLSSSQLLGVTTVSYSDIDGGWSGAGTNNINQNPLFVTGLLGDYYLSQVAAGQASDSPCVNMGSGTTANLGVDIFTTRTDNMEDEGIVDMGYHYFGFDTPFFEISTTEFDFVANRTSPDPANQLLQIRNIGIGTLNWEISYDCNWLEVLPDAGSSTGDINEVTLSVNRTGLTWGTYDCALTISDGNALNSPQIVNVGLCIDADGFDADMDVDMCDFSILASAWKSVSGEGNWNLFCDISEPNDDVIDERDLKVFAENWLLDVYVIEGIISHWTLDDGGGSVAADSVAGNDGTLYGDPAWVTGEVGTSALEFDGDGDYVRTTYEGGPSEYSISLWYNLNEDIDTSTFSGYRALVSKTGDETQYVNLWTIWFDKTKGLVFGNETAQSTYSEVMYTVPMFYKNEWHHVVVTGSTSEGKIYFDGDPKASSYDNFVTGTWDDSVPFDIGRPYGGTADRFFNGKIDDVRIYDHALSEEEVEYLYLWR